MNISESFSNDASSEVPLDIQQAIFEMTESNNYKKAAVLLKNYLTKGKNNSFGALAAVLYLKNLDLYLDGTAMEDDIKLNLKSIADKNASFELTSGLSSILQKNGKNDEAVIYLNKLENDNLTNEQNNRVLFQKAFTYLYGLKDVEKAKLYLKNIINNNETGSLNYELAQEELNSISANNFELPKQISDLKTDIPDDYKLLGNYPNPFNPSTTIKYALPKNSDVELRIYDIMGKEVKSFILNSQSTGYQNIVWNGKNNNNEQVASGIYIYRFTAKSLEDKRVFSKSAKILLMK